MFLFRAGSKVPGQVMQSMDADFLIIPVTLQRSNPASGPMLLHLCNLRNLWLKFFCFSFADKVFPFTDRLTLLRGRGALGRNQRRQSSRSSPDSALPFSGRGICFPGTTSFHVQTGSGCTPPFSSSQDVPPVF